MISPTSALVIVGMICDGMIKSGPFKVDRFFAILLRIVYNKRI